MAWAGRSAEHASVIHLIEVLISLWEVYVLALLDAQGYGYQKSFLKCILIEDLLVSIF